MTSIQLRFNKRKTSALELEPPSTIPVKQNWGCPMKDVRNRIQ